MRGGRLNRARPKVLHVTFDMDIGGTEQVIRQIINALSDEYEFSVLCIDGKIGCMGRELQRAGHPVSSFERRRGVDLKLAQHIRRMSAEQGFSVVHCHQYTPYFYGALGAGRTAKVIFTEHGRFFPDSHSWKRRALIPLLLARTYAVTAISEATRRALAVHEWIPLRRTKVIYNGISDPAGVHRPDAGLRKSLGIEEGDFLLGTVSRLDPIKNQVMMLEAFASAAARVSNLRLLIVGDGPARSDLERRCGELGLTGRVIFTGARSDALRFLALMDVFLLSSLSEGTSMTLLEAMALGKPCIATDVGGNPEVLAAGVNALITRSGDAAAFADAIVTLREDVARRVAFACASRARYLERFTVDHMVSGYRELYGAAA